MPSQVKSWTASTDPKVVGYMLRWVVPSGAINYSTAGNYLGNVLSVTLPISGMPTSSGTMKIGVTAVDDLGDESEPQEASFSFDFTDLIPPAPPPPYPTPQFVGLSEIASWGGSPWISGPTVIRGSYISIFVRLVSGEYKFYKITSNDFVTWSSPSALSIAGFDSSKRVEHPYLAKDSDGILWLWFDYLDQVDGANEIVNLYYTTSSDNGATWAAATRFTNYDTYGTVGKHPVMVQKTAAKLLLMYYEQSSAFHMTQDMSGFCHFSWHGNMQPTNISLDSANAKLYVTGSYPGMGTKMVSSIFRIDLATWTIDACWNDTTSPAFDTIHGVYNLWWARNQGAGHLIPIATMQNPDARYISLLDGQADTIRAFAFENLPAYSILKNVSGTPPTGAIQATFVEPSTSRLYVVLIGIPITIGYFDLTDPGTFDPGTGRTFYAFNVLVTDADTSTGNTDAVECSFSVYPAEDLMALSFGWMGNGYPGRLKVYTISSHLLYKDYSYARGYTNFPYRGFNRAFLKDGKIYGGVSYNASYGQGDFRGLCFVDLATDIFNYRRPPWATADNYGCYAMKDAGDGRLLVACQGYGVAVFNLTTGEWTGTLYSNDTLPGLDPSANPYAFFVLDYYSPDRMILTGNAFWTGVGNIIAFYDEGFLKKLMYRTADAAGGGAWTWSAPAQLANGYSNYDPVGAYTASSDEGLYLFWTDDISPSTPRLFWAREGNAKDLSALIEKGKDISLDWTIDGTPNKLAFTVGPGQMFDQNDLLSLYSAYLQKGAKLTVRMGEKIGGINYWQNQGTFFITQTKLNYERGQHPSMDVEAEDRRTFWESHAAVIDSFSAAYPEAILTNILENILGFSAGDISLASFDNRVLLTTQWIETVAKDIINQVCNRFGYFPKITVDNKFSARKISDSNAVDHIYPNLLKLKNFTPDLSFSDFTNRITVTGKELSEIQVLYPEERVGTLNGTIGWWGCKQTHDIHYSLDNTKRCINPRLIVLESVTSIGFKIAGVVSPWHGSSLSESISGSADFSYCTITITAPNLIADFLGAIALIVGAYFMGDIVVNWGVGKTIPVGTLIEMIAINILFAILSAVGNFQYEVYATPIGYSRRTIQNQPPHGDDLDLQTRLKAIIEQRTTDALAQSVADCNTVADQKMLVVRLQRNRAKFTKVADLRDEAGDTIQIPHPKTLQPMNFFIPRLTRRMAIPTSPGANDGYFLDDIEGWRVD